MNFSDSFDETLKQFKLTAKDLAGKSGVAESSISRFRRGEREIQSDSLERLISALPQDAKQYLFCKLLIGELDRRGIATLLSAIAHHMREDSSEDNGYCVEEKSSQTPHTIQTQAVLSLR
jgi:transcriptional regulator with XRE-family HTH domain